MISKFIRLGVENILKIICEKIIIKNIIIENKKNNNLNGIIYEIDIKAESIIFNKINISNININLRDLVLRFAFNKKKIFIDNSYAFICMKLTKDNINKTLFNDKWKNLKSSIESFVLIRFQSIEINNKSIYFVSREGFPHRSIDYTLQYDKNRIFLVNNINQEKLLLFNDKNIIVENLFFFESYIEIELSSKIIFN